MLQYTTLTNNFKLKIMNVPQFLYVIKKFSQMFLYAFSLCLSIAIMFGIPALIMELTKNNYYGWLYLISIPIGGVILYMLVELADWQEIWDLSDYDNP
jgi:hypothetical protein